VELVVAAAVEIADESGLAAVTMAAVAKRCGFTTMSLYRHVASKDELVRRMLDETLGTAPALESADWRAGLEQWSRAMLAVLELHPWGIDVPITGMLGTHAQLSWLDRGLEAIAATPGDVVVVSLGFDTYGNDPIGDFALTTAVYHECGRRVAALGRRLVILQEGGYHRPSLGANARAWLRGAEGREYEPLPAAGFGEDGSDR